MKKRKLRKEIKKALLFLVVLLTYIFTYRIAGYLGQVKAILPAAIAWICMFFIFPAIAVLLEQYIDESHK